MSPFRRLLTYVIRYRRKFVVGIVTVVASRGGYLLAPAVTGRAIDDLTRGITVSKLVRWGLLLLAIGLFGGVFRFLMRRILTSVSRDIEYDMRNEFFARDTGQNPAHHEPEDAAEEANREQQQTPPHELADRNAYREIVDRASGDGWSEQVAPTRQQDRDDADGKLATIPDDVGEKTTEWRHDRSSLPCRVDRS